MRLKSYFAESVQDAIEKARTELGPEAMLLNSRKVERGKRRGTFEVVFGVTGEPVFQRNPNLPLRALPANPSVQRKTELSGGPAVSPTEARTEVQSRTPEATAVASELAALRKQLEVVSQSLSSGNSNSELRPRKRSSLDELYSRLTEYEFSEQMSGELVSAVEGVSSSDFESTLRSTYGVDLISPERFRRALLAELDSRLEVQPELGKLGADRRIVMLIGPPGVGKTTSLVKLAVRMGVQKRVPLHLVSLDTVRVGGSEQLESFARILGVGFDALHTTSALETVLENCRDKTLVLIDSPGYAPADISDAEDTIAFLNRHPEIDVQLVLPASLRPAALAKFTERFSTFLPRKILYTHLDEVDTLGPVIENSVRAGLPISFLADGQAIPQDLHPATKTRLLTGLFASEKSATYSAA